MLGWVWEGRGGQESVKMSIAKAMPYLQISREGVIGIVGE